MIGISSIGIPKPEQKPILVECDQEGIGLANSGSKSDLNPSYEKGYLYSGPRKSQGEAAKVQRGCFQFSKSQLSSRRDR